MRKRKLLTATVVGAAGFAAVVAPASAELRTLTVTLLGGQQVTVSVDVPPGTPLDEIEIPGISDPIISVSELDGAEAASPTPSATATPELPLLPAPSAEPELYEPAPAETPRVEPPTPSAAAQPQPPSPPRAGDEPAAGDGPRSRQTTTRHRRRTANAAAPKRRRHAGERVRQRGKRPRMSPRAATDTTYSPAPPDLLATAVPNFFIDEFRIPPFLLSIYQAAGMQYGVRWEVLAAINEIETDYGRNLNVSPAGAVGWMQFMPATWEMYGTDANEDGVRDPYNPVDAIFAAARYLRAAGADTDLRRAIFAYNHADWYVDSVLMRARLIGGLPSNFVGSLTGLTQGRFPVYARARYTDDIDERAATRRVRRGNAAYLVGSDRRRRAIRIYARRGAPVVATHDARILRVGSTKRLGRFIQLQDAYGNTYTYGHLAQVNRTYPAPKPQRVTQDAIARELELPVRDPQPGAPASATARMRTGTAEVQPSRDLEAVEAGKERLFANPRRPRALRAGGDQQLLDLGIDVDGFTEYSAYLSRVFGLDRDDVVPKPLRPGAHVVAGTILGRIGRTSTGAAPHVLFEIRPAGRGAPRIDPKPILDGWRLLESTAVYRAAGRSPFFGPDAEQPSIGQILLMDKDALVRRVLANPRVAIYGCGRRDIRAGAIDRRVLATLEFLAASGFNPSVTSLECGHGYYTASGNVSHHSSGNAVDIAAVNGIPILGHQGRGSITEMVVQRLLTLQGTMKPDQIITLMSFDGTDNTLALSDHDDHIHVGWRPLFGTNSKAAKQVGAMLEPVQWIRLIDRLAELDNPTVRVKPSRYALKVHEPASRAHRGE